MSYKIIPSIDTEKFQPRDGLEGPFNFNGTALYYDPKEGKYLNPQTDFYLSHEEFQLISGE
jgi:hypothetical protein